MNVNVPMRKVGRLFPADLQCADDLLADLNPLPVKTTNVILDGFIGKGAIVLVHSLLAGFEEIGDGSFDGASVGKLYS